MAKNVFNNNKPTAQVSLNAFDNGQFQTYSMKAGIGLPCFYLHTTPKMKARINVQNYLMAENLRQNAFLRCKQNIDFFFVPYRQLNHQFSPLYYGRDDKQHAFQLATTPSVPYFDLSKVFAYLGNVYSLVRSINYLRISQYNYLKSQFDAGIFTIEECNISNFDYYLQSLSDGVVSWYQDESIDNCVSKVTSLLDDIKNVFHLLYRYFHDDGTQLSEFEDKSDESILAILLTANDFNNEDCLRILDMLGYGNFYTKYKLDYNQRIIDVVEEAINYKSLEDYLQQEFWSYNKEGSYSFYDIRGIANNFCNALDVLVGSYSIQPAKNVNAFALMAYNKIFDNIYRNNVVVPRYKYGYDLVYSFNNDGVSSNLLYGRTSAEFCSRFLCPWYIQHRRNLSNGLWNSAQFGNVSVAPTDTESDDSVSIPDLRYAFAMQTFKERLLRCGDKEKDLLKGLFGVKSRYVGDEYVYYIGSYDGVFNVNTVQDVSGENLGRLGGNIISSIQGNQLEFHCEDFGVIIGIHSILPTMLYSAFGIDLQNTKYYQFDFYHPDFENLGLQPVQKWQFISPYHGSMFQPNKIIGYGARFIEYKQKMDLSHGTFCDLPYYSNNNPTPDTFDQERGIDSDYVTNFDLSSIGSYEAQYVRPDSLDNIFDTLTDYSIESDHFKTWLNVQCDTLLPMSVLGLPQLN